MHSPHNSSHLSTKISKMSFGVWIPYSFWPFPSYFQQFPGTFASFAKGNLRVPLCSQSTSSCPSCTDGISPSRKRKTSSERRTVKFHTGQAEAQEEKENIGNHGETTSFENTSSRHSDSLFLLTPCLFSGSLHQHRLPGSILKQGETCHAGTAPSCCCSEETTSGQMQQLQPSVALTSPQ